MLKISFKNTLYCQFDALLSLGFSQTSQLSQIPIEQGSIMSDHMVLELSTYDLTAVVSLTNPVFNQNFGSNPLEATTNALQELMAKRIIFPFLIDYPGQTFLIKNAVIKDYKAEINSAHITKRKFTLTIADILLSTLEKTKGIPTQNITKKMTKKTPYDASKESKDAYWANGDKNFVNGKWQ